MISTLKLITTLMLVFFTFQASAQYREESGALEQIYEARVRSALNTVLRPNEYSVVVAVDINQDQKQLDAIEEEMGNMSLPGVPGLSMTESMSVSNKLHGLRNKVSVAMMLDESVSKEKEAAAKALVTMKLHLDESAGDSVMTTRAGMIKKVEEPKPDLLPELSWRMWALVTLVSLMALGWLAMLFNRRKKANEEKSDASLTATLKHQMPDFMPSEKAKDESPAVSADYKPSEHEKNLIEIYERKKALVQLATRYPEATAKAIEEQFEKGHQQEVMFTCEQLGWEASKGLFSNMSHRTWAKIGSLMATNQKKASEEEYLKAIDHCHRSAIAKYLELADGDVESPLGFLTKLTAEDQKTLLASESSQSLATICAYLDNSKKSALLEALSDDQQQATLLQLSKIKEVPYRSMKLIADSLRTKLQAMKENPTVQVNGQQFLINLLGELNVLAEEKFLDRLSKENPAEMAALRQSYLIFNDLVSIPSDVLSESFGGVDMQVLTYALYDASPDVRHHCFQALPEKRAKMVQKDLSYMSSLSKKECLSAQRVILKAVRASLMMSGKEPSFFLSQQTEQTDVHLKVA